MPTPKSCWRTVDGSNDGRRLRVRRGCVPRSDAEQRREYEDLRATVKADFNPPGSPPWSRRSIAICSLSGSTLGHRRDPGPPRTDARARGCNHGLHRSAQSLTAAAVTRVEERGADRWLRPALLSSAWPQVPCLDRAFAPRRGRSCRSPTVCATAVLYRDRHVVAPLTCDSAPPVRLRAELCSRILQALIFSGCSWWRTDPPRDRRSLSRRRRCVLSPSNPGVPAWTMLATRRSRCSCV
jgi:hypothetical protein